MGPDQKEDGTLDDRRRDGGTNSTLRIKEQGMHLTLNEHHDDDDDFIWSVASRLGHGTYACRMNVQGFISDLMRSS